MRATHQAGHRCAHNADHLAHDTPLSAFVAEVVCTVGATPPRIAISLPRTSTSLPRTSTSPPTNRGSCAVRGARSSSAYVEGTAKQGQLRCERCTVELGLRRGHRQTGGIASLEPRHAGDTPAGCFYWCKTPTITPGVMLPHWRHAPSLASRSLTGAGLPGGRRQMPVGRRRRCSAAQARVGWAPINAGRRRR